MAAPPGEVTVATGVEPEGCTPQAWAAQPRTRTSGQQCIQPSALVEQEEVEDGRTEDGDALGSVEAFRTEGEADRRSESSSAIGRVDGSSSQLAERGSADEIVSASTAVTAATGLTNHVTMETPVTVRELTASGFSKMSSASMFIGGVVLAGAGTIIFLLLPSMARNAGPMFFVLVVVGMIACCASIGCWLKMAMDPWADDVAPATPVQYRMWANLVAGEALAKLKPGKQDFHMMQVRLRICMGGSREIEVLRQGSVKTMRTNPMQCCLTGCSCCLADFQEVKEIALLPCGHLFCESCIARWAATGLERSRCCPICRTNFTPPHAEIDV